MPNTIPRYICRVYLDAAKQKHWPTDFVTCPRPGDLVASEDGYKMKVLSITHCTRYLNNGTGEYAPYIVVELGKWE